MRDVDDMSRGVGELRLGRKEGHGRAATPTEDVGWQDNCGAR